METSYILLGSNQGNSMLLLQQACELLQKSVGGIIKKSSVYESIPWGFEAEQNFLNQVLATETEFSPKQLLLATQQVEQQLGRIIKTYKPGVYASRLIDVDILFYGEQLIQTSALAIPHPRLHLRKFTLLPLVEIAPDFVHPVLKKTMKQLLQKCEDKGEVSILPS